MLRNELLAKQQAYARKLLMMYPRTRNNSTHLRTQHSINTLLIAGSKFYYIPTYAGYGIEQHQTDFTYPSSYTWEEVIQDFHDKAHKYYTPVANPVWLYVHSGRIALNHYSHPTILESDRDLFNKQHLGKPLYL